MDCCLSILMRDEDLAGLARQRAVGREEVVLDVLLGDRRPALGGLAALDRDEDGPGDAGRRDAVVLVEVLVLRREHRLLHVLGHLGSAAPTRGCPGRRRAAPSRSCRRSSRRSSACAVASSLASGMSVRAYAMPTATRPRAPSASTAHRARSSHFLPRGAAGGCRGTAAAGPAGAAGADRGGAVAWACLASARVAGLRWLMLLPGTGVGAVEGACGRGESARTQRSVWRSTLEKPESRAGRPGPGRHPRCIASIYLC